MHLNTRYGLALACSLLAGTANAADKEQGAVRSGPLAHSSRGRSIPVLGALKCPAESLTYHGGLVITSAKVVLIFWGPNFSNAANPDYLYAQTLRSFRDQFGTTPEYNVITQYSGIQLTNLGTGTADWFDTSTPPTNVTDYDVQLEVSYYLSFNAFDASTIYEVVIPSTSYYTDPSGGTSCGSPTTPTICAEHSWFGSGASAIKYSIQPYPSCGGLNGCQTPGWSAVQNQEHFVAHETREAVTDQQHSAWYDSSNGCEADDMCNWSPTPFIGTGGYAYQYEWSNATSSCVQSIPINSSPVVTTTSASNVSQSTATLAGTVNPRGASTNAYFQWGTTTTYGNTTFSQNVGAGTTAVPYSVNLSGLSCATTYHFQAVATNNGGTGYGDDQSFTTSVCPTAPTVTTTPASSISPTTATLGGTVNPNGTSTSAYFQWGTTTAYGNTTFSQNVGAGTASVPYGVNLSGLSCATTYHFRAVATNSGGPGYGGDQSFTTSACLTTAPTVKTTTASNITTNSGTLGGTVNPNGSSTSAYFQWGTTTAYGNTTFSQNVGAGTTSVPYGVNLPGLSCATTYHFQAVATNSGGTGYGGDQSFTTSACPTGGFFYTTTPCRLIDTRYYSPLAAGTTYEVNIAGYCRIPAAAASVSVNITEADATTGGFLALWPAQTTYPGTSIINFRAGQVRANNAILSLAPGYYGSPGAVWVSFGSASGTVDLIIDVNGYFE
jgi:hypothetical protein